MQIGQKDKKKVRIKKRFTSENNPGKGHGGKFSPYSKNFLKYEGMSDKEKEEKINEVIENTNHSVESRTTHIAYYTSRGMNEEQAKEALRQRQQTFSKEICIEKYGEEKGLERFKERQLQWEKNFPKSNYSLVSQKLFKAIDEKLDLSKFTTYYATKGEKYNNEYIIHLKDSFCKADYYVEELKCIIEFDGDYWHGEARGNQERDKERDQKLKDLGYKILHIQERKYKESPQEVVDACVAYINFLVQDKS